MRISAFFITLLCAVLCSALAQADKLGGDALDMKKVEGVASTAATAVKGVSNLPTEGVPGLGESGSERPRRSPPKFDSSKMKQKAKKQKRSPQLQDYINMAKDTILG